MDAANCSASGADISRPRPDASEIDRRLGTAALPVRAFTLLCRYNTDARRLDDVKETLTYYHSTQEPPVSLASYVERISRYSECGPEGILLGLRLAGRCHATSKITLTRLSAHRVVITGMTLGIKAHMDRFRSNKTVARAGGLRLRELNGLEYAFFREVGYRAIVTQAEMQHMLSYAAVAVELLENGQAHQAAEAAYRAFCCDPVPERACTDADVSLRAGRLHRTDSEASLESLDEDGSTEALYKPSPSAEVSEHVRDPSSLGASALGAKGHATASRYLPTPGPTSAIQAVGEDAARLRRFPAAINPLNASQNNVSMSIAKSVDVLDASALSTTSERAAQMRFHHRVMNVWRPNAPLTNEESSFFEQHELSAIGVAAPRRKSGLGQSGLNLSGFHFAGPHVPDTREDHSGERTRD
jgi:hypothetical protein